jgi:hypothetical protein
VYDLVSVGAKVHELPVGQQIVTLLAVYLVESYLGFMNI